MTGGQVIIFVALAAVVGALVWAGFQFKNMQGPKKPKPGQPGNGSTAEMAEEDVSHLFNKEFREELRNRGRLRFESIVNENAMFLKQDLDVTIAQLNEYIKKVIEKKLDEEFTAYTKAMAEARELATASLQKSANAVEEQRKAMKQMLEKNETEREAGLIKAFEENMAQVVEHYLLQTLGQQFDIRTQLPYIVTQMETNKQAISEDMRL